MTFGNCGQQPSLDGRTREGRACDNTSTDGSTGAGSSHFAGFGGAGGFSFGDTERGGGLGWLLPQLNLRPRGDVGGFFGVVDMAILHAKRRRVAQSQTQPPIPAPFPESPVLFVFGSGFFWARRRWLYSALLLLEASPGISVNTRG
jgi:hypothetical protein